LDALVTRLEGLSKELRGHRWLERITVIAAAIGLLAVAIQYYIHFEDRFKDVFQQIADMRANAIRQNDSTAQAAEAEQQHGKSLAQQIANLQQEVESLNTKEEDGKDRLNSLSAQLEGLKKESRNPSSPLGRKP
jgi:chromosome segregation ATPase